MCLHAVFYSYCVSTTPGVSVRSAMPHGPRPRRGHVHDGWQHIATGHYLARCYAWYCYAILLKGWTLPVGLVFLTLYSIAGLAELVLLLVVGYAYILCALPMLRHTTAYRPMLGLCLQCVCAPACPLSLLVYKEAMT